MEASAAALAARRAAYYSDPRFDPELLAKAAAVAYPAAPTLGVPGPMMTPELARRIGGADPADSSISVTTKAEGEENGEEQASGEGGMAYSAPSASPSPTSRRRTATSSQDGGERERKGVSQPLIQAFGAAAMVSLYGKTGGGGGGNERRSSQGGASSKGGASTTHPRQFTAPSSPARSTGSVGMAVAAGAQGGQLWSSPTPSSRKAAVTIASPSPSKQPWVGGPKRSDSGTHKGRLFLPSDAGVSP